MRVRGGKQVRPERLIELTDETIAALPVAAHGTDHWRDKALPHLMVIKPKEKNGVPLFRYAIGAHKKNVLGLDTGSTHYITIGRISLEEAKAKCRELDVKVEAGLKILEESDARPATLGAVDALMKGPPAEGEPSYDRLMSVLMDAYAQAANGKGDERHNGGGQSFENQDMVRIIAATGPDFAIGQAFKKCLEGRRMKSRKARRAEFLGAVVYLAGAVVALDREE